MRKAEMNSQVFLFILALIIFSMTLVYGYRAIQYFTDRTTEISYAQLEHEVTQEIERIKGDTFGTVKQRSFSIPGSYEAVCFVTSYGSYPAAISTPYVLVNEHIASGADDKNMFLAPPGDQSFYIGNSEVPGDSACIPVKGNKITLRIESRGDHVKVSAWD